MLGRTLELMCTYNFYNIIHGLQRAYTCMHTLHCHICMHLYTHTLIMSLILSSIHMHTHILVQNIKERHVNDGFGIPNPNNQVDAKYKDGRDSANQVAAERHQDVGESPRGDNREKANDVKRQQDAEVALENLKEEGVKQERDQDGANDGRVGKCFNYNKQGSP